MFVFDSLLSKNISLNTKQQICSFLKPLAKSVTFEVMNVMAQPNDHDCALFAIANVTEILFGHNPGKSACDVKNMWNHLITCLEQKRMEQFPIVKQRRLPFGGAVKVSVDEDIHYICRMPYDKTLDMIQCSFCSVWFHGTCVHIDNTDYLSEKWTCCKCIETND